MTDPILVIIEYVPYGDLLGYLRKSRGLNDTYFKDPDVKPQTSLTSQQLMKFSWHVAEGMRYLSSKNVSLTLKFSNFFRRNYHFIFYVFAMQRGLCWTNDTNCIECFQKKIHTKSLYNSVYTFYSPFNLSLSTFLLFYWWAGLNLERFFFSEINLVWIITKKGCFYVFIIFILLLSGFVWTWPHTNPDNLETARFFIRKDLPSTRTQWICTQKPHVRKLLFRVDFFYPTRLVNSSGAPNEN